MKRVTFKVAKALKDAGYPQKTRGTVFATETFIHNGTSFGMGCQITRPFGIPHKYLADIPTYLEVWLWLWREKKACIGILFDDGDCAVEIWSNKSFLRDFESKFDPEEAIINAIEFLVENNLIK